jgi:hypothetical protein
MTVIKEEATGTSWIKLMHRHRYKICLQYGNKLCTVKVVMTTWILYAPGSRSPWNWKYTTNFYFLMSLFHAMRTTTLSSRLNFNYEGTRKAGKLNFTSWPHGVFPWDTTMLPISTLTPNRGPIYFSTLPPWRWQLQWENFGTASTFEYIIGCKNVWTRVFARGCLCARFFISCIVMKQRNKNTILRVQNLCLWIHIPRMVKPEAGKCVLGLVRNCFPNIQMKWWKELVQEINI